MIKYPRNPGAKRAGQPGCARDDDGAEPPGDPRRAALQGSWAAQKWKDPSYGAPLNPAYERLATMRDVMRRAAQLSAQTIVIDVEPLVAYWNGSQDDLDQGVRAVLSQVTAIPGVRVVCFATNSQRRPSSVPEVPGVQVAYIASASKPVQAASYRRFPKPGVVIGDQVLTDGLLARRLGYTFLHCAPAASGIPLGPQLMKRCGDVLRPLIFRDWTGSGRPRLPGGTSGRWARTGDGGASCAADLSPVRCASVSRPPR
jgi:predicted HAD superfamily phosphohydrolase YqeG